MGWPWARFGREEWLRLPTVPTAPPTGSRGRGPAFTAGLQYDFLRARDFLVLGSATAVPFDITVPRPLPDAFTGSA